MSNGHDRIAGLVETMLNPSTRLRAWLPEDLPKAEPPHEQESLQRQIAATDNQIDALVHDWSDSGKCRPTAQLYGLTKGEIRIAEGEETR